MREYARHQRGRMFESDFFEFFSKVNPIAPFLLWVPVLIAIPAWGLATGRMSVPGLLGYGVFGFLSWQITEYFAHKKLFHWLGIGPISRRFHDIVHGFHHRYPDDPDRLVMPLAVSISIAGIVGLLLSLLDRPDFALPWFTGFLGGYLFYDFMHWSTHFRKPLTAWGRSMRAHHMTHHFGDIDKNFGISHRWMDRWLNTLDERGQKTRDQEGTS
ncbi:MAG: sterol desaturase family protein [Myxococcota bacterium]